MIHLIQFDPNRIDLNTANEQIEVIAKTFENDTLIAMPIGFNWVFDTPAYILEEYILLFEQAIKTQKEQNNDL